MKTNVHSLSKNTSSSSSSFDELIFNHTRLAELTTKDVEIQTKLALIQLQLFPCIEIIHKVISIAKEILHTLQDLLT